MSRPLVLISNDDGVNAPGIRALHAALSPVADVVVVAPETDQSGFSHALTLSRPLRHRDLGDGWHAVDGTPADCIYVALLHPTLLPRRPDVVASGINRGFNLGSDVFYSGTIAAAREGSLRGIPAIAFSLDVGHDYAAVKPYVRDMVLALTKLESYEQTPLINVNFPGGEIRGVETTRLGRRVYQDDVLIRQDPRGKEYFWIGGPEAAHHDAVAGNDTNAVSHGLVSVTPLMIDATHTAQSTAAEAVVAAIAKRG